MKTTRLRGYKLFSYILTSLVVLWSWGYLLSYSALAAPGINEQINFPGRLFNSSGATVADGFYNVQFKIYSGGDGQQADNPSGSLLWTETHLNNDSQGITIRNGFLSVSLGSITPFGSAIDWNEDTLWLSINVAGTDTSCTTFGDCGPDGEMLPMKRLTATPYSLNSAMLGGIPSGGFVQLGQGVQTDSSASSSIHIDKTGSGDFLALQSNGVDVLSLSQQGNMIFGGDDSRSLSVAQASSGAGQSLTVSAGDAAGGSDLDGGNLILQPGSGDGAGEDGEVRVEGRLAVTTLGTDDSDAVICHNSSNQLAI